MLAENEDVVTATDEISDEMKTCWRIIKMPEQRTCGRTTQPKITEFNGETGDGANPNYRLMVSPWC
jgi:hypothetical protein